MNVAENLIQIETARIVVVYIDDTGSLYIFVFITSPTNAV